MATTGLLLVDGLAPERNLMPILLQPTPRRLNRTHEPCPLGRPARLDLPPGVDPAVIAALQQELEPLFPDQEPQPEESGPVASLRFGLFDLTADDLAEVPERVRPEAIRLEVAPEGVEVRAGSFSGWLHAARTLRGLREGEELVGLALLDWPSFSRRQVDLPWPAATVSEPNLERWLGLMALCRLNYLGLADQTDANDLPDTARALAGRNGITIVAPAPGTLSLLMPEPSLFPPYATSLPALLATAQAAEAAGSDVLAFSLGALDAWTSVEAMAYGLLFAGDCAWNPRKADLKAHRRWYSARRFGFDSRAPVHAVDELEAGARALNSLPVRPSSDGADSSPQPTDLPMAVEADDPFDPALVAGVAQPDELAADLGRHAAAAMAALAPLQPDSEEKATALQGLQWTAQRLKMAGRRLATAEQVRQLYRAAHVAAASPRAVSQRLLRAADLLEAEARTLEEHRAEWHALWRRERLGPYDPGTEAALRAPVEAFNARAARLRSLRDLYVQTGTLPSPAAENLERTGTRLAEGIVPSRLPPQPSPAWWPEGGAARLRIDVDCPDAAAGIPWEVQVDFRALAGETGAFNVRSARLLPLTETDEAGPEQPCQLVRGGFVFVAEPGSRTYFLYLDPLPGPDFGFRETRTGQSRSGVRLENRRMQLRLSPRDGLVSGWRFSETALEFLPPGPEADEPEDTGRRPRGGEGANTQSLGWRLRVLETGPLLARARADHSGGLIRQLDLLAGQVWGELSTNTPWSEFFLPTRPELWTEGTVALFGGGDHPTRQRLLAPQVMEPEALWSAIHRPDGLTLALLPDGPTRAILSPEGLRLEGLPYGGSICFFAAWESDPAAALGRLLEVRRNPPRVRLGIIEERRVREF
jgi:hypothetical protein